MNVRLVPGHDPGPYTGAGSNTWLIGGSVPTLIDTASGRPEHVREVAAAFDDSAVAPQVLVTHAHPDHAGGAAAISVRWPGARFAKFPWPDRDPGYPVSWRALADDDLVAAGDEQLWVVHTPGHSPDHVCFFEPRSGTLFGGDLVMNGGTVVIPALHGGSLSQYLASLKRVLDLQPRRILPGHGSVIEQPASLLRGYIAHRLARERQILEALQRGATDVESIVQRVYPELHPDVVPAARESVIAHLRKLEEDGRAHSTPHDGESAALWRLS
jgi:hydroxyacylglutathione hydrolase